MTGAFAMTRPLPEPKSILEYLPARMGNSARVPWISITAEKSWKPLRFFADGRGFSSCGAWCRAP
jgi:hypothetical protein